MSDTSWAFQSFEVNWMCFSSFSVQSMYQRNILLFVKPLNRFISRYEFHWRGGQINHLRHWGSFWYRSTWSATFIASWAIMGKFSLEIKKKVVYAKHVDDICRGDWGPFESAFFNNTYIRSAESCTLVLQWYTHFKEHWSSWVCRLIRGGRSVSGEGGRGGG